MEEILDKDLINLIKEKFPNFIPYWELHANYWGKDLEDLGLTCHMGPLIDYAVNVIKSQNDDEIKIFFDFIEFLMCKGNEYVQTSIATSFLEGLLNKDPDEIHFTEFSQYLGKETVAYLRAWNKFNGTHTDGL